MPCSCSTCCNILQRWHTASHSECNALQPHSATHTRPSNSHAEHASCTAAVICRNGSSLQVFANHHSVKAVTYMDLAFYRVEPTLHLTHIQSALKLLSKSRWQLFNHAQPLLPLCPLHKPCVRVPLAVQLPIVISHRLWCDGGRVLLCVPICPLDLQQHASSGCS